MVIVSYVTKWKHPTWTAWSCLFQCTTTMGKPGLLFDFPVSCLLSWRYKTTLILRDAAKFHLCSPQEFVYEDGQKLSTNWKITPTFTRNKTSFFGSLERFNRAKQALVWREGEMRGISMSFSRKTCKGQGGFWINFDNDLEQGLEGQERCKLSLILSLKDF